MTRPTPGAVAPVPAQPNGAQTGTRLVVPRVAPQRRWRPALFWLAVALVVAGGLIGWRVLTRVGSTTQYLAVARTVEAGAIVDRADVVTVRINAAPGLRPVRAEKIDQVLGKHAAEKLGINRVDAQPAVFIGDQAYTVIGILDAVEELVPGENA